MDTAESRKREGKQRSVVLVPVDDSNKPHIGTVPIPQVTLADPETDLTASSGEHVGGACGPSSQQNSPRAKKSTKSFLSLPFKSLREASRSASQKISRRLSRDVSPSSSRDSDQMSRSLDTSYASSSAKSTLEKPARKNKKKDKKNKSKGVSTALPPAEHDEGDELQQSSKGPSFSKDDEVKQGKNKKKSTSLVRKLSAKYRSSKTFGNKDSPPVSPSSRDSDLPGYDPSADDSQSMASSLTSDPIRSPDQSPMRGFPPPGGIANALEASLMINNPGSNNIDQVTMTSLSLKGNKDETENSVENMKSGQEGKEEETSQRPSPTPPPRKQQKIGGLFDVQPPKQSFDSGVVVRTPLVESFRPALVESTSTSYSAAAPSPFVVKSTHQVTMATSPANLSRYSSMGDGEPEATAPGSSSSSPTKLRTEEGEGRQRRPSLMEELMAADVEGEKTTPESAGYNEPSGGCGDEQDSDKKRGLESPEPMEESAKPEDDEEAGSEESPPEADLHPQKPAATSTPIIKFPLSLNIPVPQLPQIPGTSKQNPPRAQGGEQGAAQRCEHLYKILVIGELGTGKTSIIKRYVHQFFSQHYRATIGVDFALKVLTWDQNTVIRLQLWDIAGQERFGNMTRVYYKEAVGAFIVFDVTRTATFDAVLKWKADLDSKVQLPDGSPIPCVLLANKCDQQKEGLVNTPARMDEYCKENGFAGWYETSAKENINIDEAARFLVTKILQNDKVSHATMARDKEGFALDGTANKYDSGESKSCPC